METKRLFDYLDTSSLLAFCEIEKKVLLTLADSTFERDLSCIESFFNTHLNGKQFYKVLLHDKTEVKLKLMGIKRFKPWYRNVTAETNNDVIEMNPKFIKRPKSEIANTLIHEWLHGVGYGHIYNNPRRYPQILESANYVIGEMVETHYRRMFGE